MCLSSVVSFILTIPSIFFRYDCVNNLCLILILFMPKTGMLEIVEQVHFETLFDVEWRKRSPIENVSEFVARSLVVIHTHFYHSCFGNLCRIFL